MDKVMTLRIYNTLTGKKEVFEPLEEGKFRMYVCGPTVYDYCHIGHARSVVVFDVIARYMKILGYDVTYVRNFTDVDDKIINRANQSGLDSKEVSEKFIREFHTDMDALNIERATIEPKATEHIGQIIKLNETLISKGHAYVVDGDVYFSVESFKDYGRLSGRRLEDMEAGARIDIDERKKSPFDFALWKSAKPGEPSWDSPWGKGRPGWHIECSAMSQEYLGKTFDVHGGGKDLIFPHHENEIAQSEAAFGQKFARFWVHNGFVNINHEKMSKSLGNFLMIKDVLKQYHPDTVRLFLLSNHYRSPIDFTDKAMDEVQTALDKIYALLERVDSMADDNNGPDYAETGLWKRFTEAMNDDFNTAKGVGVIFEYIRSFNRTLDEKKNYVPGEVSNGIADLKKAAGVLGILTQSHQDYFALKKTRAVEESEVDPAAVESLINERNEARKSKNFARADEIRDELAKMNVVLEDRPDGTVWKIEK